MYRQSHQRYVLHTRDSAMQKWDMVPNVVRTVACRMVSIKWTIATSQPANYNNRRCITSWKANFSIGRRFKSRVSKQGCWSGIYTHKNLFPLHFSSLLFSCLRFVPPTAQPADSRARLLQWYQGHQVLQNKNKVL